MGIDVAAERKEKEQKEALSLKKQQDRERLKKGVAAFKEGFKGSGYICTQCGRQGKPALITKGSIFIEIVLWLMFLLPGLIYSIWRHASRVKGCPDCKTPTMIKTDSPIGKQLLNTLDN